MIKRILLGILVIFIIAFGYVYLTLFPQFPVANGYAAKKMCSCTFIADRSQESIQKDDLGFGPTGLTKSVIDYEQKSVTSSLFGMSPKTAVYRDDLGCILLQGKDDYQTTLKIERPTLSDTLEWPLGTQVTPVDSMENVDLEQLQTAILNNFDPSLDMDSVKTRAIVVVHKGRLIAEQYAKGFDADTEILGWSMTKSITSTMVGILAKNGMLSLEDTGLFPKWTDKRKDISLKDLLQMQSGLEFNEDYTRNSDATKMLYKSENVSEIPLNKPLKHDPGTYWSYSSGTTNLLSRIVKEKLDEEAYLRLPYDSIFNQIGMTSAVMETDESGLYIGSSYCYATPRDWAKFGLLYLNQGNWYGNQVIDSSWVDFVRTPASDSKGIYGGQFWLNVNHSQYPDCPEEVYSCNGFQGQRVIMVPSYDLVIVRMGLEEPPVFDMNKLLKEILDCFSKE